MINNTAENSRYKDESHYKALRDDYKTPECIYGPILRYFERDKFDIDVCCSDRNIPARHYYTKDGIFHNSTDNGLIRPWRGFVFCNPVWKYTIKWIKKGVTELALNPDLIVTYVLSADKMYIGYVQDHILNNPDAVWFVLRGKQGFIIPGQEDEPPVPSVGTMVAILSKRAGEIQYGMNYYNLFDTYIYRGERLKTEYKQQCIFQGAKNE